ncbi:uncharacterized protein AMSG_01947 [Thecamonas trahens ATCC 50062]|uniref:Cell division cycle protein 123 n=1 Tax=Thecamonas trahens ATCC 50062 TaxID=461836 RepID=A0A0L0DU06_THETB|nr:hypothetical protein AMSG_01947 [Thecamonas trahens ATCC 50062]KNC55677.1 hypothetical protein AMSG_01947 [Thecamonas trahens ATCC 50062]|eukprot:XP_013761445.1 hypothetical protein AMSG_01947 [Thecamonas trahens ATCC 50062]
MSFASVLSKVSLKKTNADQAIGAGDGGSARLAAAVAAEREAHARLRECDLEAWYARLEGETFKTVFVPLSQDAARALMAGYEAQCGRASLSEEASAELEALTASIAAAMVDLGASNVFAKLSSRSPKDSTLCEARALDAIKAELGDALASGATLDANTVFRSVMAAGIAALRSDSAAQVVASLMSSDRVCADDIPLALEHAHQWSQHVVLREWVSLPPWSELRGFVVDGKLTALSQYFVGVRFDELVAARDAVEALVKAAFDDFAPRLGISSCVLDLAVDLDAGRVYVIELNPFGPPDGLGTGTCLFNLATDADVLFGAAPFEFRIQHEPLASLADLLRDGPLRDWLDDAGVLQALI